MHGIGLHGVLQNEQQRHMKATLELESYNINLTDRFNKWIKILQKYSLKFIVKYFNVTKFRRFRVLGVVREVHSSETQNFAHSRNLIPAKVFFTLKFQILFFMYIPPINRFNFKIYFSNFGPSAKFNYCGIWILKSSAKFNSSKN